VIKKILLVKLDHIGDTILSLPAIKMLRMRFPDAHITMLSSSWAKDIVEKVAELDEVIVFDLFHRESEKGENKDILKELKKLESKLRVRNFDLAVDLRRNTETRKIIKLSSARYMVGYETASDESWLSLSLRLTDEIRDRSGVARKPHMMIQLCRLVSSIPVKDSNNLSGNIGLPLLKFDLEKKKNILFSFNNLFKGSLIIGVHIGCGSAIRQWPIEYFSWLIDLLVKNNNADIILFGGENDKNKAKELMSMVSDKRRIVSLVGKISLDEFMYLVKECDVFIGSISGPSHVASFLGVPTLVIFAGQVSPYEWSPIGERALVIRSAISCSPCYKVLAQECPYGLKCLKSIWPEKVLEAIYQLLYIP
jgi:lipopolysaccharide heptosyltransferase II